MRTKIFYKIDYESVKLTRRLRDYKSVGMEGKEHKVFLNHKFDVLMCEYTRDIIISKFYIYLYRVQSVHLLVRGGYREGWG